jgi:hypothetical protein
MGTENKAEAKERNRINEISWECGGIHPIHQFKNSDYK